MTRDEALKVCDAIKQYGVLDARRMELSKLASTFAHGYMRIEFQDTMDDKRNIGFDIDARFIYAITAYLTYEMFNIERRLSKLGVTL